MTFSGVDLSLARLASAYACAVAVGSLVGTIIFLAIADGPGSVLYGFHAVVLLSVMVLPFLLAGALPFTALSMVLILWLRLRGWLAFVLLGCLCSATVISIWAVRSGGTRMDFSTSPPQEIASYGVAGLLVAFLLFAPAGGIAGWIFWRIGFARPDDRKMSS